MSFRQHDNNPDTIWRQAHRADLLVAGLPDFLIDDERRWNFAILHGYDGHGSGWCPDWLTKEQAVTLLRLLESHYECRTGLILFDVLEKRICETTRNQSRGGA